MNNTLIAVLEVKGVITHAEALELVDHLANNPQSTYYADALNDIKKLTARSAKPALPTLSSLGSVGPEQFAEEVAAREPVVPVIGTAPKLTVKQPLPEHGATYTPSEDISKKQ